VLCRSIAVEVLKGHSLDSPQEKLRRDKPHFIRPRLHAPRRSFVMKIVGILHGASQAEGQQDITNITNYLNANCDSAPTIVAPDWTVDLATRAQKLVGQKVTVLLAASGSKSAHAAITATGNNKTPVIVFTSVAPGILNLILSPTTTTGVCAHTSDKDDVRLNFLLDFINKNPSSIGLLYSSNRDDTVKQLKAINDAAAARNCKIVPADLNTSLTMTQAFQKFTTANVDGVLVAADPFFYRNMTEVVADMTKAKFPAIYQWGEFVVAGGLMSYGLIRNNCYTLADGMVATIINGNPIPPIWQPQPGDFQLVVSQSRAQSFGKWPLPASFAGAIIKP
jgi:putative ABC transport system substrate-binding protein